MDGGGANPKITCTQISPPSVIANDVFAPPQQPCIDTVAKILGSVIALKFLPPPPICTTPPTMNNDRSLTLEVFNPQNESAALRSKFK